MRFALLHSVRSTTRGGWISSCDCSRFSGSFSTSVDSGSIFFISPSVKPSCDIAPRRGGQISVRRRSLQVLQCDSFSLSQAPSRLLNALEEARVLLQSVLKPF